MKGSTKMSIIKKAEATSTAVDKANARVAEVLQSYQDQLDTIDTNIANAQKAVKDAEAKEDVATKDLDATAYQAAAADLQTAQLQVEMYTRRKTELKSGPLMDQSEYESLCDSVKAELDAAKKDTAAQIVTLMDQIDTLVNSLDQKASAANEALYNLQGKAYRNADVVRGFGVLHADADNIVNWWHVTTHNTAYENMKEGKV